MNFADAAIFITNLIVIYVCSGMLVTIILVGISEVFQWRARHLKFSIMNLFDPGNKTKDSYRFIAELYRHPAINSLVQRPSWQQFVQPPVGPEEIPAEAFAEALLSILEIYDDKITKKLSDYISSEIISPIDIAVPGRTRYTSIWEAIEINRLEHLTCTSHE